MLSEVMEAMTLTMTNRSKHVRSHRPLRYLDLSFEGRQQANSAGVNNGVRPHGGCRGRRKHPLSYLSHDKPVDYHKQLRNDIDRLLEDDVLEVHGSPTWVCDASREMTHSGESPLIANKFLAASKVDSPRSAGSSRRVKSAKSSNNYAAPPARDGVQYYRPNRTHQYLTTTDLRDCSQNETNLKYGRPTRTTLLRARQRSNSAPINAYEIRREMLRKTEERRTKNYTINTSEMLHINTGSGETTHSWLIGARYNRAHYVDAKSFNLYGMYMPRNNLMGTFVTHSVTNLLKEVDGENYPTAPPDTSRSEEEMTTYHTQRVVSAPTRRQHPGNSPPPSTRHVWGDSQNSGQLDQAENETEQQNSRQIIEEVIDGLNIRGNRMSGTKGKLYSAKTEQEDKPILPMVQGMSWKSPRRKAPCESGAYQQPPPPTPVGHQSLKDFSENVKLEDLIVKTALSARGPLSASSKSLIEPPKEDGAPTPKKIKPILVDRSVNCPSVNGDTGQIDGQTGNSISQDKAQEQPQEIKTDSITDPPISVDNRTTMDQSEAEKTSTRGNTSMEVRGESFIVSERSLDNELPDTYNVKDTTDNNDKPQIQLPLSDACENNTGDVLPQNNVAFFITEDDSKKDNNESGKSENLEEPSNVNEPEAAIPEQTERELLDGIENTVLQETEFSVLESTGNIVEDLSGEENVVKEERVEETVSDINTDRTLSDSQTDDKNGHVNIYGSYDDDCDDKDTAYKITVDICKKGQ